MYFRFGYVDDFKVGDIDDCDVINSTFHDNSAGRYGGAITM